MPTSAFLQLSDRCNHACGHCYQVHGERGELTTTEVKRLLEDLAAAGVLILTLSGGEVTLREDLLEVIEYARGLRFGVKLYTNGFLVDDAMARRFAELAVMDVGVSVYSARPAVHDGITRVPGSLDRTLEGVRALRRHGVSVRLKLTLMSVNSDSYREVIELAKELGCGYLVSPNVEVREDGNREPTALRASEEAIRGILKDSDLHFGPGGEAFEPRDAEATACGACATATVMPDGTIRPCTSLPFALGNVRNGSIVDAYTGSETLSFVTSLRWKDLPACGVCEIRDYCARCHAAALLEDGDIFGPSTTSCRWARARFHYARGTEAGVNDPALGPFAIADGGALVQRSWDRSARKVPTGVPWSVVEGKERHRRIRLRVVAG
jgi:radical SAM protein with 4Fe4S-binding SPASM domain